MDDKKNRRKIKIAAMADLHVHEHATDLYKELFAEISQKADVLVLCGDLTQVGNPKEAENLASDLQSCTIPVVGILGNHDYHEGKVKEVKEILSQAGLQFIDEKPFELEGVGFCGVKGFCGGFNAQMLGSFGEKMIKDFVQESINEELALENLLAQMKTPKKVVALHYAPIPDTLRGEPLEIFHFLGSSRLSEPINRYDVDLVFHGHAHYGSYEGKTLKGIPVYNCSIDVMKRKNVNQPYALMEL